METMGQKLNERREKILGHESISYYIHDLYRTASKKELNHILVQTEKKSIEMNSNFFSEKYKRDYLAAEIKVLKHSIVKIDAKLGECKTDDKVSTTDRHLIKVNFFI